MSGQAISLNDIGRGLRILGEKVDRIGDPRGTPSLTGRQKFVRHAVLQLLANYERRGVGELYLQRYVSRAATGPASTTVPGWAAELHSTALLDFLNSGQAPALLPRLQELAIRVQLAAGGTMNLPYRPAGSPAGGWVAEGQPVSIIAFMLSSLGLIGHKLAAISTFTQELAASSAIEQIVDIMLRRDLASIIDSALTDDQPASASRPKGLRNGIAALTPGADMQADLAALTKAVLDGGGTAPAIVANPLQALSLAFAPNALPFPVLSSPNVAQGVVIALDLESFVASLTSPRISVSQNPAVNMADPATAIGTAGSPNVVAAPTRSLWQSDTFGVKTVIDASWGVVPGRVAWSTVTW